MKVNLNNLTQCINDMSYKEIKLAVGNFDLTSYSVDEIEMLTAILKQDCRSNVRKISEGIVKSLSLYDKEIARVRALYEFDRSFGKYEFIAGVDEVGRGPLAGPIVGAAVILDLNKTSESDLILGINDSKKLTDKRRRELSSIIREKCICYSINICSNNEIDDKGIAYCNNQIFMEACNSLKIKPDLILSDGYGIKGCDVENKFIIKGDTKSASIACASIIAKVYRDSLMEEYGKIYPQYGFDRNAGYGTKEHIEGIKQYGATPIHRKSFLRGILESKSL
jgi:ribonuclease HII